MAKRKKSKRQKLIEKCDKLFSKIVRHYEKECVTCGDTEHGQCGHYVSRSCKTLRWDFRNAHRQCYTCNVALNGNMTSYSLYMLERYGQDELWELERIRIEEKKGNITVKTSDIEATLAILTKMTNAIEDEDYNTDDLDSVIASASKSND